MKKSELSQDSEKSLNRFKIKIRNIMKQLHWSVLLIIILCIFFIGTMGVCNMLWGKEIPQALLTTLSSIIFALIGYGVGKSEET